MITQKIQKILAQTGIASRRTLEKWIADGRITVNGVVAKLGDRIDSHAEIKIDGKFFKIESIKNPRLLAYYKPEGEICTTSDPEGRPTVFKHLPVLSKARWISVGRLDINTSGLLLFTNDGELAHRLMHPSFNLEREYLVRILGKATQEILDMLKKGVQLEDGVSKFESIEKQRSSGINQWYRVIVKEGKHRLVRRLWESQGFKVSRLIRIRYGEITLPKFLKPGQWYEITPDRIG